MINNETPWWPAVVCFAVGFMLTLCALMLTSCHSPMPPIDVSFWAGDSASDGISRSQENKTLKCSDPSFDNYVAITYSDIQKIFNTMLLCKDWGSAKAMSPYEAKRFMNRNAEVVRYVMGHQRAVGLEPIHY